MRRGLNTRAPRHTPGARSDGDVCAVVAPNGAERGRADCARVRGAVARALVPTRSRRGRRSWHRSAPRRAPDRARRRAARTRPLDVSARAARGGRGGRGGRRGGASGGGRGGAPADAALLTGPSERLGGVEESPSARLPRPLPPQACAPRACASASPSASPLTASPPSRISAADPLLSPAARKDPAKAQEERRKIWARLGAADPSASASSSTPRGFSHLLDADPNANASSSSSGNPRGTSRGANGTRQRGSSRATLRVGFTAHREKFAKALRLELEEEMDRAKERLDTWDRARLQREGYALFGLRGMRDGTLQRDAVIRVEAPRRRVRRRSGRRRRRRRFVADSRWAPSFRSTVSRRATWFL